MGWSSAAGATVTADAVKDADVVLKVRRPAAGELAADVSKADEADFAIVHIVQVTARGSG